MSYKSPIEIIYGDMKSQMENEVYNVVQSYGINVDKEELIKALQYDRNQYYKGYEDAQAELERKKGKWIENHTTCSECGWQMIDDVLESPNMVFFNYCPNCGADMRGDR